MALVGGRRLSGGRISLLFSPLSGHVCWWRRQRASLRAARTVACAPVRLRRRDGRPNGRQLVRRTRHRRALPRRTQAAPRASPLHVAQSARRVDPHLRRRRPVQRTARLRMASRSGLLVQTPRTGPERLPDLLGDRRLRRGRQRFGVGSGSALQLSAVASRDVY